MKVLDLACRHGHVFEGWFGSEDDYRVQRNRGIVTCPVCGDAEVAKRLSAPRLNLGRPPAGGAPITPDPQGPQADQVHDVAMPQAIQAAWLRMAREVMARTEDVGARFAEEARRMHHGDMEVRPIRGQATARETVELLDEGIDVLPLLLPQAVKETLQ